MPDDAVQAFGPAAGYIIGILLTAVSGLTASNIFQYKQANKVNGYRLTERDTLRDALNASAKSIEAQNKASEERNRVTGELAEAMRMLSASFDKLTDRLSMQHEHGRDKSTEQARQTEKLIESFVSISETLRNTGAIVSDIRNHLGKNGIL